MPQPQPLNFSGVIRRPSRVSRSRRGVGCAHLDTTARSAADACEPSRQVEVGNSAPSRRRRPPPKPRSRGRGATRSATPTRLWTFWIPRMTPRSIGRFGVSHLLQSWHSLKASSPPATHVLLRTECNRRCLPHPTDPRMTRMKRIRPYSPSLICQGITPGTMALLHAPAAVVAAGQQYAGPTSMPVSNADQHWCRQPRQLGSTGTGARPPLTPLAPPHATARSSPPPADTHRGPRRPSIPRPAAAPRQPPPTPCAAATATSS